ncbi:Nuclear transport factor 2 [Orbilia brochopaga]|uniref:Nuclear transport factor 2 n=1 Tax=Orbilia brochopaga TaxID=3140254 RepID=A0AAV9USL9_9PEZI
MADYESVAKQFTDFYYQTFGQNRAGLAGLYRPDSLLTFETTQTPGGEAIIQKLVELPFQKMQHHVVTLNAQPSADGSIQVLVTGYIKLDEEPQPQTFAESFHLKPDGGSYYIAHDIFRLIFPP